MHGHYDPWNTSTSGPINLLRDPVVMGSTLRITICREYTSWRGHNEAGQRRTGRVIEIIFFGIATRDVPNVIGQCGRQRTKLRLVLVTCNHLKWEVGR